MEWFFYAYAFAKAYIKPTFDPIEFFIDVILPIPVENPFTYAVNRDEAAFLKPGMRVAVPFGKRKVYAGIVKQVHQTAPVIYEAKDIEYILDERPIVTPEQFKLWSFIASYYMCTEGEVMRAAIPSILLLESETVVKGTGIAADDTQLTDDEFLIYEALQHQSEVKIEQIISILGKRTVFPAIQSLLEKGILSLQENVREQYSPKLVKYVKLHSDYESDAGMQQLMEMLSRAAKQRAVVMQYYTMMAQTQQPIKVKELQRKADATSTQIKSLIDKGIFELTEIREDRIQFSNDTEETKALNPYQVKALQEIEESFETKDVCLLHGVTASGKTEIYVRLIENLLATEKQVLYLLPEIALTTQLIERLKVYFGNKVAVFHSKYSQNERVEVWNNVYDVLPKAQIVIGARSALLLPFSKLGLVIVDEEHESSFKQFDPAPRYHARDCAVMLASIHKAKVLLGSATPALETYHNALTGKYGLVTLTQRHGNILMPEINLVDIKEKYRKKQMTGHFSDTLLRAMTDVLKENKQIILFQNRRGFSPIVECTTCGHSPQCPNCDVSLTYHKYKGQLRCHYCSYHIAMQQKCMACGSYDLDTKGFGTEQIEIELKELYPEHTIGRMDSDTTRGKYGFERIINAFQSGEIDILVGTQMLTKGLDFRNVTLVGILQADGMLNFPDFRAHERSYQLIGQVSGRAGRTDEQGKVLVQTYNPYHQILQQVSANKYVAMFEEQLEERRTFHYPPYYRLIRITLKHRDFQKTEDSSLWLAQALRQVLGDAAVLGPETPPVARIRNMYHKNIMIKLSRKRNLTQTKQAIAKVKSSFMAVGAFRPVRLIIDVDCY